ncbi:Adenosine deaminase 2-A (Cat eye syndrome critical region protein 1 homolog A), partial [Durusdinium trenchii]
MASLFEARKALLKRQVLLESFHSVNYDLVDSDAEREAEAAFGKCLRDDTCIDTGVDFLQHDRDAMDRSLVLKVIKAMPKGAMLHTHGIATGSFETMVGILKRSPCVCMLDDPSQSNHGEIRSFGRAEREALGPAWKSLKDLEDEKILGLIRVPPSATREERWPEFIKCWERVKELSKTITTWKGKGSYFWSMLERLLETGITYVEIKTVLQHEWVLPSEDGSVVDRTAEVDQFVETFVSTVDLFKSEHPTFVGAKIVWCSIKVFEPAEIAANVEVVLRLERDFPGAIAGYDLVGHEDTLDTIEKYSEALASYRDRGGRLLLHAGETVDPHGEQLYDAIALDSERIGHAFSLPKHPSLVRIVREKGITVECCPISNQVLGLVADMKNHTGHIMVNSGLKLTISSDDAAMFGYDDVSYDWALVAKA